MADAEEDFTALPLPDRFVHKNWKVRKEGYEAAAKEFSLAASEADPVVRQFIQDSGIWKGVVGDANVAAQQEGLAALCSFLEIAGTQGCTRSVLFRGDAMYMYRGAMLMLVQDAAAHNIRYR
jgi:hypothetical protein